MKKNLRLISIFIAASVMFSLCACSDKTDSDVDNGQNNLNSSAPAVSYSVTLPVAHNDTVDPFKDITLPFI